MFVHKTGNRIVDAALLSLNDRIIVLESVTIVPGRLISDIDLPNGQPVDISHFLGRRWAGYHTCSCRGALTPGFIQDEASPDDTRLLRLIANGYGATVRISLWVF